MRQSSGVYSQLRLQEGNTLTWASCMIIGDVELVAKLEDELKHEKASGLEDLESSVQNIQYVLQNNSWEVRSSMKNH